jgi:hypothetical protein
LSPTKIRIWGIFGIILILFSIGFAALPLIPNSSLDVIRITVRQRALEERIVKDALTLTYQPSSRVQAVSELQNTLPVWEQVQNGLMNGDTSLGISPNQPSDTKLLLLQAQSDFVNMDTSARQILAHPSPVDATQLSIILQHEQSYYTTMAHVDSLSEDHILWITRLYFGIGIAISIVLLLIWIRFFRTIARKNEEKET